MFSFTDSPDLCPGALSVTFVLLISWLQIVQYTTSSCFPSSVHVGFTMLSFTFSPAICTACSIITPHPQVFQWFVLSDSQGTFVPSCGIISISLLVLLISAPQTEQYTTSS